MLSDEMDDSIFLTPELLAITSPASVSPPSSASPAPQRSQQPRVSLQRQLASMQPAPFPTSPRSASPPPSLTTSSYFLGTVQPQPQLQPSSSSSSSSSSGSLSARPAVLSSFDEAPTLASFFGTSPRGMTTVIRTADLSPSKRPPTSSPQPSPSRSRRADVIDLVDDGPFSPQRPASTPVPARSAIAIKAGAASSFSSPSVSQQTAAAPVSISSLTAHSEQLLSGLLAAHNSPVKAVKASRRSGKPAKLRVHLQLVGAGLVGVSSQPDDHRVTDIVRSVQGSAWDEKLKLWLCPVAALNAVRARLAALGDAHTELTIDEPDAAFIAEEQAAGTAEAAAGDDGKAADGSQYDFMRRIPRKLARVLYPFQRDGVNFCIQHGGRALIGDEMGLGKTLQSLAVCAYYHNEWPVLIVCPSSLRLNWKTEIQRWLPSVLHREISVIMSGQDRLLHRTLQGGISTRFTIISYDLVAKFEAAIRKADYQIAVVDESHYLKNVKAKRSQALLPLLRRAKRCVLLSGTPALSRPIELYSQVNAVSPALFPDYHKFGMRYAQGKKGRFGWEYRGSSHLAELHFLLKRHCMIRRLKEDVLTELRPKTRTAVMVSIDNPEVERICKRLGHLKDAAERLVDADGYSGSSSSGSGGPLSGFSAESRDLLFEMFKKTGEAKLSAVLQYIADMLTNGCKFLVFAHHRSVLDGIEQFLQKERVGHFRLDGSTSAAARQAGVDSFQTDSSVRVALLSITAGGTGITLTASSTVVFAELQWTPSLLLQAEDRVHRIGQPNAVNVHYLLGRHSLDELLWPLLVKKMQVVGSTLDGEEEEMDFASVRGEEAEKSRFRQSNAMADWLQREAQRKEEQRQREQQTRERRSKQWRDAIEIGSDDEPDDHPLSRRLPAAAQAGKEAKQEEAEEEEETRDSMWLYVSDDNEDEMAGFIVDDEEEDEAEQEDGVAEAALDARRGGDDVEEVEDEEDEYGQQRYDSDEEYRPPRGEQEDDDDEGEAEYLPLAHSKARRRVIDSPDAAEARAEEDEEEGDQEEKEKSSSRRRPAPTGGRGRASRASQPPASSSSSSSSLSARSPWAAVFGINQQIIDEESERQQRAEQRRSQQRQRQREDDEKDVISRRKKRRSEQEMEEKEERAEEEEQQDGGGMTARDLRIMLLGMDFRSELVERALTAMQEKPGSGRDARRLLDVNDAIERLTTLTSNEESRKAGQQLESTDWRAEEKKDEQDEQSVWDDSQQEDERVPCERCNEPIAFSRYAQHTVGCRRGAGDATELQHDDNEEAADSGSKKIEAREEAEEQQQEDEEEELQEIVRSRSNRRRSMIVDLEDQEVEEERIVTPKAVSRGRAAAVEEKQEEQESAGDDSVPDVQWLDE